MRYIRYIYHRENVIILLLRIASFIFAIFRTFEFRNMLLWRV